VVPAVDDLAAWLAGLLADADRKKLATLVLGDVQGRALRQAAAAVQDTATELSPSDSRRAGQIAMVIRGLPRAGAGCAAGRGGHAGGGAAGGGSGPAGSPG
jgi:hypothetical protein